MASQNLETLRYSFSQDNGNRRVGDRGTDDAGISRVLWLLYLLHV